MSGQHWQTMSDRSRVIFHERLDKREEEEIIDKSRNINEFREYKWRYGFKIYFYNMEQLSSSVVSIQDFEEEIWGSNPHIIWRRMNIYTFYIFTNHCIAVEEIDETHIIGFHLHHLEIGPLYLPEPSHLKIIWTSVNWNKTSNTLSSAGGKQKLGKNSK